MLCPGNGLGDPGYDSQHGEESSFLKTGSGAHPASLSVVFSAVSPDTKRTGHEVDHSPMSTGEVKHVCTHTCTYPPPPPHLNSRRGQEQFYLYFFTLNFVMTVINIQGLLRVIFTGKRLRFMV